MSPSTIWGTRVVVKTLGVSFTGKIHTFRVTGHTFTESGFHTPPAGHTARTPPSGSDNKVHTQPPAGTLWPPDQTRTATLGLRARTTVSRLRGRADLLLEACDPLANGLRVILTADLGNGSSQVILTTIVRGAAARVLRASQTDRVCALARTLAGL